MASLVPPGGKPQMTLASSRLAWASADRGKPAHVLLSFAEYQRLTQQRRNIADALAMPVGGAVCDFEAPRADIAVQAADLS